jgi:hypothetical protein
MRKKEISDKRVERKYKRVAKRIENATGNPKKEARIQKKYGYNYAGAKEAGLEPDETGHWPSRRPDTGEILKGRRHPTIARTKAGEKAAGYKMYRKDGKMYSRRKK